MFVECLFVEIGSTFFMPSVTLPLISHPSTGDMVLPDDVLSNGGLQAHSASRYGGKALGLVRLVDQGFPVPPFFMVAADVFWKALSPEQRRRWQESPLTSDDRADVLSAIEGFEWGYTHTQQLHQHLQSICPDGRSVAVRSSARREDSAEHSFAGMFESVLCVPHHQVLQSIKTVWRSALGDDVWAYAQARNLPLTLQLPSVVVQRVIQADVSGVAFSAEPVSGQRGLATVSAVYGLGSLLVSGESEAMTFQVASATPLPPFEPEQLLDVQYPLQPQSQYHHWIRDELQSDDESQGNKASDFVAVSEVPPAWSERWPLDEASVKTIASMAWDCEMLNNGRPQDIEWAVENDHLFILQARPISAGAIRHSKHRVDYTSWPVKCFWSRDTAQETWPEPVKPATLAFARRWVAVTHKILTRKACVAKVPESEYEWMFTELIGSIGHRLYRHQSLIENLWRQAPSLTYTFKRCQGILGRFIPALRFAPESSYAQLYTGSGGLDSIGLLVKTLVQGSFRSIQLLGDIQQLPQRQQHFVAMMHDYQETFQQHPPVHLAGVVERLEMLDALWGRLGDVSALSNYWATLLTDVLDEHLGSVGIRWRDVDCHLRTTCDFVGDLSDPMTFYQRMQQSEQTVYHALASLKLSDDVHQHFWDADHAEASWQVIQQSACQDVIEQHLNRFGLRCANEMILEKPVAIQHPAECMALLHTVWVTHHHATKEGDTPPQEAPLSKSTLPWTHGLWKPLVQHAQTHLLTREYVRYAMSQWVHLYRLTLQAAGEQLANLGCLTQANDVFFLMIEEVEQLCMGHLTVDDAQQCIEVRQAQYAVDVPEEGRREAVPSTWFSFGRYVNAAMNTTHHSVNATEQDPLQRCGQPIAEGRVTAPVLVWRGDGLPPVNECVGKILVVRQGSPALVGLYSVLSGLVMEVGSPLSHPAIVAREMQLPTVVRIAKATEWLANDERVELDGRQGWVKKLSQKN